MWRIIVQINCLAGSSNCNYLDSYQIELQAVPRKGFASADCEHRDREIVSKQANPNHSRGTAGSKWLCV
jgi:hypothetical protein